MKKCNKCGQLKENEFYSKNPSRKDGLNSRCKTCQSEYIKQHYLKRKEYYVSKAKLSNQRKSEWLREIKNLYKIACVECGYDKHVEALDFHHKDRETKSFDINQAKSQSKKAIIEELNKCEVLCANCHRIRTYNER